jgi:hypothetical protein
MACTLKGLFFGLLLNVFFCVGAYANTYTAASCSASDMQTAINSTSNGDTVLIPASSCTGGITWSSPITITTAITLNGQGATVTWASGGYILVTANSSGNTFVTGFNFQQGFTGGGCPVHFTSSNSPMTLPFRFYNNTFTDNGLQSSGVTMVCMSGLGPGLIDHNTFTVNHGADEIIHNLGAGSPTNYGGWSVDVTPGGPNMLFVENNTFTYNAVTSPANNPAGPYYFWGTSAIEDFYGSQLVFRYNTMNYVQVDAHGSSPGTCSGSGTENSTRWYEVYNNTWNIPTANSNQSNYTDFRGGSGVAWGNTVNGASNNTVEGGIEFTEDCTSGGTWPLNTQVGRGINENTGGPAYAWGNNSSMVVYSGNTNYVLAGSSLSACSHTPCDVVSLSSAPTTLTRCESAADVTAGCPVTYTYTPYTYPHPLENAVPPSAPSNVQAVAH